MLRSVAALRIGILVALLGVHISGVAGQSTPLTIISVGTGSSCPIVGGLGSWTATSVGGTAPVEYQFWLRNDTAGTWTLLKDYSPAKAATWTPRASGAYFTQVWARSAGSTAAWEAWLNSATCVVTGSNALTVTGVTATPPAGGVPNPIVWTVSASGGVAPLQYQFWLFNYKTATWTLLKDYGTASTATWTPATPGTYHLQAWVRSAGSAAAWEAWLNSLPVVVYPQTTISSVTLTPASPVSVGQPATWAATASGGVAPLQYQFWLRNETAGTWTLLRDYAEAKTAPWTPETAGTYFVQVWTRSAGSSADWEAWNNSEIVVAAETTSSFLWTTVVSHGGTHEINWARTGSSDRYRVYRASSRQQLQGPLPAAAFFEVNAPPLTLNVANPAAPVYYRVFGMNGSQIGIGGPVAVSTTMTAVDVPMQGVTPALWDIDGDGCLDIVGAQGLCNGQFELRPLALSGLAGLFASGRVNRDSRFADFNGDGHVDIFTNVYSPADNPSSRAILHVGDGAGHFTEDPGVAALQIGGFGETVVAADFDNDGDIDLFLPHYSHRGDGGHNWLLVNDGLGHFTDVAASAGVANNLPFVPEGAQAIDFNQDGWIDLLVSSHLYINNGNLTFTDRAADVALPARFDEGLRLFDVDMDGDFDLIHHDSFVTKLYRNTQGRFDGGTDVDGDPARTTYGYGLNVCDVNGDGFEDVLVANNSSSSRTGAPHLLVNVGGTLTRSDFVTGGAAYNDLIACTDLDGSGLPDVLARWSTLANGYRSLINQAGSDVTIRLRVVGSGGERNQQGRLVRLRPKGTTAPTLLRVVEAGSGYMAQNDYDLLIAAPWAGDYEVSVLFADGWFVTTARPGDELTVYADHRVGPMASPLPKLTSVTPTPALSGPVGAPVTWTAEARNGVAPLEYTILASQRDGGHLDNGRLRHKQYRDLDARYGRHLFRPGLGAFGRFDGRVGRLAQQLGVHRDAALTLGVWCCGAKPTRI